MFKRIKQCILSFVLAAMVFSQMGCFALVVGAAAGAGGVIWAKGALHQDLSRPLDRTYKAAKIALDQMDLPILVDKKDNLTARIESEFADGKKVKIDLDYVSKNTSKISIRIGTLGDEIRSREILQTILKYL